MRHLNKLRWRCRRGTLELDLMLTGYLENRYFHTGNLAQKAFLQLLELEDSELIRYFMEGGVPDSTELAELVAKIRIFDARQAR